MCGEIRKSTSSEQAVEFGLAYAVHQTDYDDGPFSVREEAKWFINSYVPAEQRTRAIHLLAQREDDQLGSTLSYFGDVVV